MSNSSDLYSRQSSLLLKEYKCAIVVGLGGIGNWVALDLALSGKVQKLILIDGDKVEYHNLNRTMFRLCDIGEYKVDAIKYQILERRCECEIVTYPQLTDEKLISELYSSLVRDPSIYDRNLLIMDCRDDIFDDFYDFNCKLYKVGYDGTSMTIDGNPRLTKVFTQRGGSYSVVPSYIGSSQIVAALAVNDALGAGIVTNETFETIATYKFSENPFLREQALDNGRDEYGRLNCNITFSCQDIFSKCCPDQVKEYDSSDVEEVIANQYEEERLQKQAQEKDDD